MNTRNMLIIYGIAAAISLAGLWQWGKWIVNFSRFIG